jgi:hypothetical protein
MTRKVNLANLTKEEALDWLDANDTDFNWRTELPEANFLQAVADNIISYGYEGQSGDIIIVPLITETI